MQRPAEPSHVARVEVYLPKLALISGRAVMLPVSNFGVLVRLKTSQLNAILVPSVILQILRRDVSIVEKPSPRNWLRKPTSPGRSRRKAVTAPLPCAKGLG